MKKLIFYLLLLALISCSNSPKELAGIWEVKSPFYKAIYSIEDQNDKMVGKILYYNDDTYIYRETGTKKDVFLHQLEKKGDLYIDAISGATISKKGITLKLIGKDTLEVTSYIRNNPLKEFWIKKTNYNEHY
ncbi:hypothetical protein RQM59_09515 [Flavobacteriaceae bacterium S356]|uniref:Lipocalin-like domain-containing protein n=1 Tax=Asprobacillus argus TaxID=3076534 RepID=A0ABU3LGR1_9FLAO|nr:hypothetical protein [Flavobacteriaceae bacterium S356]